MQTTKIQYFENAQKTKHRDFIIAQNNCVLCGTVLELRHLVDKDSGQIKEEAHCTQCEVRTRAKTHNLN